MKKFSIYYETDNDSGGFVIEAETREEAEHKAKEKLNYDVNYIEAHEVTK